MSHAPALKKHLNVCIICESKFLTRQPAKYCSDQCMRKKIQAKIRKKLGIKKMKKTCPFCDKMFTTYIRHQIYCSHQCSEKQSRLKYKGLYEETKKHSLRFKILARDKFTCQYCGKSPQEGIILHVDHIKPRSKGGKDTKENLLTSCENCNLGKSTKDYLAEILNYCKERKKTFDV